MTLNKIASLVAKREGKKSQARIGDIREILKILVDLSVEQWREGAVYGVALSDLLVIADKKMEKIARKLDQKKVRK